MTSLVDGARRLLGRSSPTLGERLGGLEAAVAAARGRLDDDLLDRAEAVVGRATARLALAGDHTVVALAGATGSGKSSLFNALSGADLAAVGVRRPTTSATTAASWGPEAGDVLAWLGVSRRHRPAPPDGSGAALDGLVLLDLPDHDSTEVEHHVEVDRLVELVDLLVWVVDPQKYADAALHERYLRRFPDHEDVMVVVLNHVDEVAGPQRAAMVDDLRRLLRADGLADVPVLTSSAVTGEGVEALRTLVAGRVGRKKAAAARLTADVVAVSRALTEASGDADPAPVDQAGRAELVDSFADAAGVPTVVAAVERAIVRRGGRQTGWPVTAWLSRLRPDPLRRLHLDLDPTGRQLTRVARTSVPEPTRVQRARVDTAVRAVADQVGAGLAQPWADAVRRASLSRLADLNDALDRALAGTDLGVARTPLWWRSVRVVQALLAVAMVVGVLWLGALAAVGWLRLTLPEVPEWRGLPVPTLLLLGGAGGGIALGVVARMGTAMVARSRARAADRRLRRAIATVTDELVVAPVDAELEAYAVVRAGLATALGAGRRG